MIEANNPDINVDELMSKVREEVAQRKQIEASPVSPINHEPPIASDRSQRQTQFQADWQADLKIAERQTDLGSFIPSWERFGWLRRTVSRLMARVVLFCSSFLTNWQKEFNQAIFRAVRSVGESQTQQLHMLKEQLSTLQKEAQQLHDEYGRLDGSLRGEVARLETSLEEQKSRFEKERAQLDRSLRGEVARLETSLEQQKSRLAEDRPQSDHTLNRLRIELLTQERRVAILLEEARKRLPEPFDTEQLTVLATEDSHRLEALYLSLEDQFRGTREDIKDRLRVYVPMLHDAHLGTENMPILDVGCGRGELLEVLRTEGLVGRGIDTNRVLLEQCQQRGLSVAEGDCVDYLQDLPDASLGAVTVIHLIEHLPLPRLVGLLDEIVRILKPGGMAVFETPNCF